MDATNWIWVACAIAGGVFQTVRNVMQRQLTDRLGTIGATHVRFLYGLPFGLAFALAATLAAGGGLPPMSWTFVAWVALGALTQIAGTALMLAAMRERSFVVTTAYLKTEPMQIALFGLVFLGERLGPQATLAVALATAGVVLMSLPARVAPADRGAATQGDDAPSRTPGAVRAGGPDDRRLGRLGAGGPDDRRLGRLRAGGPDGRHLGRLRPAALGIASGGMFALAAVGFRGSILALGDADPPWLRATTALACTLALQAVLLSAWLALRRRAVLVEILRAWRPSTLAGCMGALASASWFLAFSLQSAAAVRTVGLLEILFAHAASRRLFAQRLSRAEALGIATMMTGLALLLNA